MQVLEPSRPRTSFLSSSVQACSSARSTLASSSSITMPVYIAYLVFYPPQNLFRDGTGEGGMSVELLFFALVTQRGDAVPKLFPPLAASRYAPADCDQLRPSLPLPASL